MKTKLLIIFAICSALSALAMPKEFERIIPAVDSKQYNQWSGSESFVHGVEAINNKEYDTAIEAFGKELQLHPTNGYAACNLAVSKLLTMDSLEPEGDYFHNDDELGSDVMEVQHQRQAAKQALREEIVTLFSRAVELIPAVDTVSLCVAYRGMAAVLTAQQANQSLVKNAIDKALTLHPCKAAYITRLFIDIVDHEYVEEDKAEAKKREYETFINDINEFYNRYPNELEPLAFKIITMREEQDAQSVVELSDKFFRLLKTADTKNLIFEIDDNVISNINDVRVSALLDLGRYSEAADICLDKMVKNGDSDLYENNLHLIAEKDPGMLIMKIKQRQFVSENDENNWDLLLGNISQRYLKDYNEALKYLVPALAKNPGDEKLIESIAECHYMVGDIDKAMIYAEAAEMSSSGSMLHENMLIAMGQVDDLIRKYEARLALGDVIQTESYDYFRLGYLNMLKRDWPRAETYLRKCLDMSRNKVPVLYNLGVALKAVGKTAEAKNCFDTALQDEDANLEGFEDVYALLLTEAGNTLDAREILEVATEREYMPISYYDAACCYATLGDNDKMLECMRKHFDNELHNFGLIDMDWRLDKVRNLSEFKKLIDTEKKKYQTVSPERKK